MCPNLFALARALRQLSTSRFIERDSVDRMRNNSIINVIKPSGLLGFCPVGRRGQDQRSLNRRDSPDIISSGKKRKRTSWWPQLVLLLLNRRHQAVGKERADHMVVWWWLALHLPTTLSVGLFHHPLSQSEPPTTTTQGRRPSPFQETWRGEQQQHCSTGATFEKATKKVSAPPPSYSSPPGGVVLGVG